MFLLANSRKEGFIFRNGFRVVYPFGKLKLMIWVLCINFVGSGRSSVCSSMKALENSMRFPFQLRFQVELPWKAGTVGHSKRVSKCRTLKGSLFVVQKLLIGHVHSKLLWFVS